MKKNITRFLQVQVEEKLFQGKIIILYGARQVGKTTLVKEILQKHSDSLFISGDEPDIRGALSNKTSTELKQFLGNHKLIIIDEAQRIKNIGLTLKLLVDTYPEMQIIATGSSSFDLSNEIVEPLTGRKFEFFLPPFSLAEINPSSIELQRILGHRMIYGMYPDVVLSSGSETEDRIKEIAKSYLFQDILVFQKIRHSEVLEKLLQALALQLGNEVSFNEMASLVGVDKNTVSHYIGILEKAFIIFRLKPFSRNLRTELKKLRKIYFWDTGIRNALIRNFNPLDLRNDTGALFENFVISERYKRNIAQRYSPNTYFWRTHQQQEIDYIEELKGKMSAFEFKWKESKRFSVPKSFIGSYPDTTVTCVHKENMTDFVL